jgi:DNA-binding NarL/FixJ family response regulator
MALLLQQLPAHEYAARDRDRTAVRPPIRRSNPPPHAAAALSALAIHADATSSPVVDLSAVWHDFLDGRLRFHSVDRTTSRLYVLARCADPGEPSTSLSPVETTVLARVLCGEQQKLVACESGMACSTASKWFTRGLEKLKLDRTVVPLALVTSAQSWALGRTPAVDARSGRFDLADGSFFFLSIARPVVGPESSLSPSEREVARRLIEGDSRWEIAAARSTSTQTVACQFRAIFSKLHLTGRYALIRHVSELGWFSR